MEKRKKKYRAAVIGCGRIGADEGLYSKKLRPGTHAGAYFTNKRVELIALADTDREKLKNASKYFPGVKLYTNIRKMLGENQLDIVSIATPTQCHHEHVCLAASYKYPVIFCEKPMSYSMREAADMISICKKNKVNLFINHQRRFDPLLQKWSQKVKDGLLGKIYQGSAYYFNGLFNNGTHIVDLLRMYLGEPTSVVGRYNPVTSADFPKPNIDGLINFNNGLIVSLKSLNNNYGYFGLDFFGERGLFSIENLGFSIKFQKKIVNKNYRSYFCLSDKILREGVPRSMLSSAISCLIDYLDGKSPKLTSTGEDSLRTLKVLLALKKSADSNGKDINIEK